MPLPRCADSVCGAPRETDFEHAGLEIRDPHVQELGIVLPGGGGACSTYPSPGMGQESRADQSPGGTTFG